LKIEKLLRFFTAARATVVRVVVTGAIGGFFVVLFTYFGVRYLLRGLHGYL